ncbi:hypothetical protein [Aureimonas sp. SK2]|uniref:hypothetical protein n=1 Tax=Aureimonas sp. SK2 TaxID=3015992 RepID=UPI0024452D03|nr:hypothetical protein [Aureimonas sp. SK2]
MDVLSDQDYGGVTRILRLPSATLPHEPATKSQLDAQSVANWPAFIGAWPLFGAMPQLLPTGQFATLPMSVVADNRNAWSAGDGHYVVPEDGLYQCIGKYRVFDGSPSTSHGIGIDIVNEDSPSFFWKGTETGTNPSRNGIMNVVHMSVTAGARIRMFGYTDMDLTVMATALTILRVR